MDFGGDKEGWGSHLTHSLHWVDRLRRFTRLLGAGLGGRAGKPISDTLSNIEFSRHRRLNLTCGT
jgi:hypothetical protein